MSGISSPVSATTDWNSICFPVYTEKLSDLLPPGYAVKATDRQKLIVAEQNGPDGQLVRNVVANQSTGYSLVPNALIREAVDSCLADYQLNVLATRNYEYSIQVVLPDQLLVAGERINRCIMFKNSYNGKTKFSVQGTAARKKTSLQ